MTPSHIAPGEQLWSRYGRRLPVVPNFNAGGAGQRRSTRSVARWLVDEARIEMAEMVRRGEAGETRWFQDAVADADPNNLSPWDAALLREVLFGSELGPIQKNRCYPPLDLSE